MIGRKEMLKMLYMGYQIKAVFERPNKVRFTKYFSTADEAETFIKAAKANGMKWLETDELFG